MTARINAGDDYNDKWEDGKVAMETNFPEDV